MLMKNDAVLVRLQCALLTRVVDSRRNVMLALGQHLVGRESGIGVEPAIEEFVIDAFRSVLSKCVVALD